MPIRTRTHIHACTYTHHTKHVRSTWHFFQNSMQVNINVYILSVYCVIYLCTYVRTYSSLCWYNMLLLSLLMTQQQQQQQEQISCTYLCSCSTADRAKSIKTRATINESPTDKLIRELREENSRLLEMLKGMKTGVAGELGQPQGVSEEGVSPCTHKCCRKYYSCVHTYTQTTQSKVFSSSIL